MPDPSVASRARRRRLRLIAVLGALVAIGTPLVWFLSRPADTAGDAAAVEDALRAATSISTVPAPEISGPDSGSAATAPTTTLPPSLRFTVSDSTLVPEAPAPTGLRIGEIGVDAPVEAYGVDRRTGEMDVPDNVRDVAWYQFGPSPGQPGSAVLAAHVDLASQGAGVFFNLDELEPGDIVSVDYDDGSSQDFEVRARVKYEKTGIPLDVIFATEGPPVLTLITCGGGFNPSIRTYDSNIVVYAFPVGAAGEAPVE
jgi:hypothetical protein